MALPPLMLSSIDSFFVGGGSTRLSGLPVQHRSMVLNGAPREIDPNGVHTHGQMYVQSYCLAHPRSQIPVLLWHGGGMTGVTWETTPDGRRGWIDLFLRAGYNVMVGDAVERGRSSFAMVPQIFREPPVFRTKEEGWKTFRLGLRYDENPAERHTFADQRFPVASFDDFAKQWVPRWPAHEPIILAAYEALVRKVGPCFIVGHSQGAGFAAEVARSMPDQVRAVVAIEPGGMPMEGPTGPLPPHLFVWGDHIEPSGSHWIGYRDQADRYQASIAPCAQTTLLDLPAEGTHGNSHFPMMDDNSHEVFELVLNWLQQRS